MRDFQLPLVLCPYCGKELDGAMNMTGDKRPKDGDASVCLTCENIGIFIVKGDIFGLRMPTLEEYNTVQEMDEIQFFLHCLREAKRLRREAGE